MGRAKKARTVTGIEVTEAVPALSWLTPRRVIVFLVAWLALFGLGSILVANPFVSETTAGATPDYWHVMYLHGLLIGMAGLIALVALEMFEGICSTHVRTGILVGVIVATVLTTTGGIFDRRIPGDEIPRWIHIIGAFSLDGILILLILGLAQGWCARLQSSPTLPFLVAWMASISMLIAAVMGHIGGWTLEFNNHPRLLGSWANLAGESLDKLRDNLTGSHSHEMVVASMALVLAGAVHRFGYPGAAGISRSVSRLGMSMVGLGVFSMTCLYVTMAVTSWVVPSFFQSAHGTNGLAGDDILTGVLVMGGGLLALWPLVPGVIDRARSWTESSLAIAAAWVWTAIMIGVPISGYWIELHETFYGSGNAKAPGALNDAIYTWVHQDIALFLLPALFAILLLSDRLVAPRCKGFIAWMAMAGVAMLLVGGGIWAFVSPVVHGAGYALSTTGLLLVGSSIAVAIRSACRQREQRDKRRNPPFRRSAEDDHPDKRPAPAIRSSV